MIVLQVIFAIVLALVYLGRSPRLSNGLSYSSHPTHRILLLASYSSHPTSHVLLLASYSSHPTSRIPLHFSITQTIQLPQSGGAPSLTKGLSYFAVTTAFASSFNPAFGLGLYVAGLAGFGVNLNSHPSRFLV